MTKDVAVISTEVRAALALESDVVENQLILLVEKSKHITTITNNDGCKQVHGSRMDLKNARVGIQNSAKDARSDATAFSKAVIAEEKRLIDIIASEETRLNELETAWEAEKERARRERDEAEKARVDAINAKIKAIAQHGCTLLSSSAQIQNIICQATAIEIDEKVFFEMTAFAQSTKDDVLAELAGLMGAALLHEASQAAIEVERKRLADEATKQAEAALAEKEKQLLEQQALDAERAKEKEQRRIEQEAFEAERAEFNRQKVAHEAKVAEARLAEEADRVEAERVEADRTKVTEIVDLVEPVELIVFDPFTATLNAPVDNVAQAFPRHEPLSEVDQLKEANEIIFQLIKFCDDFMDEDFDLNKYAPYTNAVAYMGKARI